MGNCCKNSRSLYKKIINYNPVSYDHKLFTKLFNVEKEGFLVTLPDNKINHKITLFDSELRINENLAKVQGKINIFSLDKCFFEIETCITDLTPERKFYHGKYKIYSPEKIFQKPTVILGGFCNIEIYSTHFQILPDFSEGGFVYRDNTHPAQVLEVSLLMFPLSFISWEYMSTPIISDLSTINIKTPSQLLNIYKEKCKKDSQKFLQYLCDKSVRNAALLTCQITQWSQKTMS